MKRSIIFGLLIILIILLAACSENKNHDGIQTSAEPTGASFMENVINKRGAIEITPSLRESFNAFARDYQWTYLPDMDGYESFFEADDYADSFGYTNFGYAVFYVLHYTGEQKISENDMQNYLYALFAAKNHYEPMIHRDYRKLANYENGYYSPWIEEIPDPEREFYLLTALDVRQDDASGPVYITVNLKNYYFADTSDYEAGDAEKWLAQKAQEMGCNDLEAAAKLIANGEIGELPGRVEYETTMVVDKAEKSSEDLAFKFLSNHSSWINR